MWDRQHNNLIALIFFVTIIGSPKTVNADIFPPSPSCFKPSKPYTFSTQWDVDSYNSSVRRYKMCVETFIDEQKKEKDQHQQAINDVIDEWNDYVNYNR